MVNCWDKLHSHSSSRSPIISRHGANRHPVRVPVRVRRRPCTRERLPRLARSGGPLSRHRQRPHGRRCVGLSHCHLHKHSLLLLLLNTMLFYTIRIMHISLLHTRSLKERELKRENLHHKNTTPCLMTERQCGSRHVLVFSDFRFPPPSHSTRR